MLVASISSNSGPVRQTGAVEAKPAQTRQPLAETDDQSQLIAYVGNLTRADAAQVIALTQRGPSQQSYDTVASAYSEF